MNEQIAIARISAAAWVRSAVRAIVAPMLGAALITSIIGRAAAGEDPDWPCVQRKVPEISPAKVGGGPPLDADDDWRDDSPLAELAGTIASRRTDLADAKGKIAEFVAAAGADRNRRLTLLFAGVLASINAERSSIMAG